MYPGSENAQFVFLATFRVSLPLLLIIKGYGCTQELIPNILHRHNGSEVNGFDSFSCDDVNLKYCC